jgi:hypothetical protein
MSHFSIAQTDYASEVESITVEAIGKITSSGRRGGRQRVTEFGEA